MFISDSPISTRGDYQKVGTETGRSIALHCEVCANPIPSDFMWKFNGEGLRDGIDGQGTDTITILEVAEDLSDFGFYTCDVTNTVGIRQLTVELVPYGILL